MISQPSVGLSWIGHPPAIRVSMIGIGGIAAALLLAASLVTLLPTSVRADDPTEAGAAATGNEAEATLSYLNRPIMVFRSTIGSMTPRQRAERAHRRLIELESNILERPIEMNPIEFARQEGILLTIGGHSLFMAPASTDEDRKCAHAEVFQSAP